MRTSRLSMLTASLLLLASLAAAAGSPELPAPGPKERCPVCGMFVGMHRAWTAAVVFKDGATSFFDGPKDMFRFVAEPGRFAKGRNSSDIQGAYVTEYYSARLTRAEGLYFVVGSDVLGPMGRELIPVEGKEQADTFAVDHKGKKILRFDEVTPEELKKLE
jgi:copper chaperone NosL